MTLLAGCGGDAEPSATPDTAQVPNTTPIPDTTDESAAPDTRASAGFPLDFHTEGNRIVDSSGHTVVPRG